MTHSVIDLIARAGLTPQTLTGQTAFITGAGGGIGREAAIALAWLGARVVIAELNATSGQETQALIQNVGGTARFIHTDVSSLESVQAAAAQTQAAFGTVDILINNAILCPVASVVDMDVALWDKVVAVNLRGAFLTCKAFLPGMLAAAAGQPSTQPGTIVNMISVDAMPGLAAYIATKNGLLGFSKTLAVEVGEQGIRVVPFVPGMVDTLGIRGVAAGIAPRLGISEQQFMSLSLHQAFDGLMPVEYAGAATAYLVCRLADEYHGEQITGYEVLERARLIQAASLPEDALEDQGAVPLQPSQPAAGLPERLHELARILAETDDEFKGLPIFARPLARNGFKNKTGLSTADWQRLVANLEGGAPPAADLAARLDKLAGYYRDVPRETARFVKDPEILGQITETSQQRVAVIQALRQALN